MKKVNVIIGLLIFIISLILAFHYKYNHFYEILMIGLFILFTGLISLKLTRKQILLFYCYGIIYGLIVDLILGLAITKLWIYPNYSWWEYLLIYLLIYPLGSVVIVQTYLFFEKIIVKERKKTNKTRFFFLQIITILSFLGVILTFIFKEKLTYSGFVFFFFAIAFIIFGLNWLSSVVNKNSLWKQFLGNKKMYFLVLLISSYIHATLHEYPNTFVYQWIYQNLPFENIVFLNVPILAFLGWIILIVIPVSFYYLIKN